ncbi:MAG: transposase family protein, partial [Pseudonocardiaceae bacterium]
SCMSEVPMAAADAVVGELVTHAVSLHAASGGDLLGCFASVVDPRDPRGVRHSLATILAMCTAAVLCGCTSLDDITAWVGSVDRGVLAVLGCRRNALEVLTPPRPETVTRVFAELGAQALAGHAGVLLARRAGLAPVAFPISAPGWLPAIAVDGKALRGAAGTDGDVPYLLAAATHDRCAVVAERLIGPKSTEVPQFAPLLRELNDHVGLSGHVVTVDAGHTVRAHATFLCEELGAHYIMTVKTTTPTLFATLDALDWTTVAVGHSRSPRRWPRCASPACPPARPHPSTSPATSAATGP